MRSPLALIEVGEPNAKTGEYERKWQVVRTADAAKGLKAYRVVFVREPTPEEYPVVMNTLGHSAEPEPQAVKLEDVFRIMGTKNLAPLAKILRGKS